MSPRLQNSQAGDGFFIRMLFILIPIAWLAILTLFVTVCRAAADGDAQLDPSAPPLSGPIGMKLVLAPASPTPTGAARRPHLRQGPRRAPAATTRRRRLAAHSGR